ncbi:carbohydrate ABC transporter permease [Treponema parvum]|uniref:carbohydrate ABC transporter permease n=1 Tax=Treponema parvum TaxID=138851 RepID=UPI001AEC2B8D|nr:carbohydrate ABC transporter permease [Treponema parvum]
MMKGQAKEKIIYHILVCIIGFSMIYPLLWMIMSSFKPTNTIFTTASKLIPKEFVLSNYRTGWKGFTPGQTFAIYFRNSLFISLTATFGAALSSAVVAFAMSRLHFFGKKFLKAMILVSMMLPAQILMIPQYLWYLHLGWVGTYLPLIVPSWFATHGFFIYLMMNFIDGIPRELDEAAKIDGCSYYRTFVVIILPLLVPAIVTSCIFSFIWRWDDFLSALLYVKQTTQYPVSLALKLFCDPGSSSDYGAMFAMSTLSLLPVMLIFIFLQKYLVEGISTSGLKG